MTKEIIIAGFGSQGIVSSGIILGYAGMLENKNVTFFPSYGAEMRGGTANCSVVISSEPVASPIVAYPDIVIIMNPIYCEEIRRDFELMGLGPEILTT